MMNPARGAQSSRKRLFVEAPLAAGERFALTPAQAHYVRNVLRLREADELVAFNGRDGEWLVRIATVGRRGASAEPVSPTRPQEPAADLDYLFAPLKHARLDYMAQKATEMGVARLRPVTTRRTAVGRVNLDRLRTNAIEAAEQCGLLFVPEVNAPEMLEDVLDRWPAERALVFADEAAEVASPVAALEALAGRPLAVLIGPEGGFDADERARLRGHAAGVAISLGPRVMRADTAAVAALALVQALAGDWPRALR